MDIEVCKYCQGAGELDSIKTLGEVYYTEIGPCPECHGNGTTTPTNEKKKSSILKAVEAILEAQAKKTV
jgi:DnaJ-class molecular chaperone